VTEAYCDSCPKAKWSPKPGDLVQIWDHLGPNGRKTEFKTTIDGHGWLGYVVGDSTNPKHRAAGAVRVICFGKNDDPSVGKIIDVNVTWLRKIDNSSDILKVQSDSLSQNR
tara:strand:- start:36588 stop:36920 length:333 start_codon:yes stop_codon:yes gene_type:complete